MEPIPYTSFFNELRKHGFSVTHTQILQAYKIILKYAGKVKEEELCLFLVPVFANSEGEQQLFKELFSAAFIAREPLKIRKSIYQQINRQGKKNPGLLILLYFVVASLLVYFIVNSFNKYTSFDATWVQVIVKDSKAGDEAPPDEKIFSVHANEALLLDAYVRYRDEPLKDLVVKANYNWGDDTTITSSSSHTYKAAGEYRITVYAEVLYREESVLKYTLTYTANVCPAAELELSVSEKEAFIPVGRTILFNARVNLRSDEGDAVLFQWQDGSRILGNQSRLRIAFDSAGSHNIICIAHFGDINSSCRLQKNILLNIGTNQHEKVAVQKEALPVTTVTDKKSSAGFQPGSKTFLYWMYALATIIFCGLSMLFFVLYQKAIVVKTGWKSPAANQHLHLQVSPLAKRLKKDLRFKQHNYLVVDQHRLGEIVKPLRSRIKGTVEVTDVQKTIQKSIRSFGLLQPVTSPVTRPPEYLLLIDRHPGNVLMLQFFEYLADLLKQHNIVLEKFYFSQDPSLCFNPNEPGGISLDKLSARYSRHILLLLGDAHQLVQESYPVMDARYPGILQSWQYKAVITPVAYPDWGVKEQVLSAVLPMFPADMEALSILAALLFAEKKDNAIMLRLRAASADFYSSKEFDFDDIDQLAAYCEQAGDCRISRDGVAVNVLFEWIKALAVYPRIEWTLIIAIGKAILEKYQAPGLLHFTNLLRIVRIDWIKQGVFPDGIRLELLKVLPVQNEVIARETVLSLLNEIPDAALAKDTTGYEEKALQKLINEFNLYAHHPALYPQYQYAKTAFEQRWMDDQVDDAPLQLYLTNKDGDWQNLLQHERVKGYLGITQYFEAIEIENNNLSRLYLWLSLISVLVMVSSFFAILILYRWDAVGL